VVSTPPTMMRAVRLHEPTGVAGLRTDRVPVPDPSRGEALVRVRAAALTRDELDWPVDRLPAIPSYELSGIVVGLGEGVTEVRVGDRVCGLMPFDRDGAAAEYATVPADLLAETPAGLDDVHAAALPLPGLTAWQSLFDHGGMDKGQRVLVLGAAGGVGQLVTQLARLHGASVVGTASPAGRDLALRHGASQVVDPTDRAGVQRIEPVNLVVDTVGGQVVQLAGTRLRLGGRLVSVAADPPTPADRSVTTSYFVVTPDHDQLAELCRLAGLGELTVTVDSVHPLDAAAAAFTRLQEPGKRGKVVLQVDDD
jgi:NADPH:quinone reductase-like Zn-dependent oxidoreductase